MTDGRSPKRKGTRVEQELARLLLELGFICSRVLLSGAAGSEFAGVLRVELHGHVYRVEVKARHEFRTLYRLTHADLLLLKADRQPSLAVVPLSLLSQLLTSEARP